MTTRHKMGYVPDVADHRDLMFADLLLARSFSGPTQALPPRVSLIKYCSPIENQGQLGSCTAQAGVGALELLNIKKKGKTADHSRLFLYKTTRMALGWQGDTGATIRETLRSMIRLGVCTENYWPYDIRTFDRLPSQGLYTNALNYQTLKYYRCTTIEHVKQCLAWGYPVMFGFPCYDHTFDPPGGVITMPSQSQPPRGGHAVLAVGYDDAEDCLIIRNSWGVGYGSSGYVWMVNDYFRSGLANDIWAVADCE